LELDLGENDASCVEKREYIGFFILFQIYFRGNDECGEAKESRSLLI
jgi:hypothetical protein